MQFSTILSALSLAAAASAISGTFHTRARPLKTEP